MPNVTMPNGDIVSFPDDMPRDQIKGMIASKFPEIAAQKPVGNSKIESGIAGAAQGATLNFGDEMMAGLTAPVIAGGSKIANKFGYTTPYDNKSIGDIYSMERQKIEGDNQRASGDNPVSYGAGYLTGAIGTGVGGAATKTGGAIANSLRGGNLPARIAKGFAAGATSGAVSGAGGASEGERLKGAESGAILGGVVGGALPVAGAIAKGAVKEVKSLAPKTAQSASELRAASKPYFDKFTQSGAVYSPKLTDEIANLAQAAKSNGIAGSTKSADDSLNQALDFYASLKGKTLSPADIQKLDQSFADDIARFNRAGEYNFGRILNNLKYEFRNRAFNQQNAPNYVIGSPNAVKDLVEGNRLWSQSYKAGDIEKILQKSQGTENPQTSIRTGLKNLLANDNKMARYGDAEKEVLREALKRGVTGGSVKLFGGRLINSLAGAGAGFSSAGPLGAVGGAVAGKAAGGVMADVAGSIQANRLRGALGQIQQGVKPAIKNKAITPMLSAPAGAGAVTYEGMSRPPLRIKITPQDKIPEPVPNENLPKIGPQSALFNRVIQQESGGKQFDKSGNPLRSKVGAVGIAQVMPKTAPEAARLAGLPYDVKRLYQDADYNAALGEAYLNKQIQDFGDEKLALMAYSWGPGNVKAWLKSGARPEKIPEETRNYIASILGA